jgi:hypothetical protein
LLDVRPRTGQYKANCGNGQRDDGELCDTEIAQGKEGACPTVCPIDDPCILQTLAGSDCSAQCVTLSITKAMNDDGCCPKGVGPAEDGDCGGCGDGIIAPPKETCDPPATCTRAQDCTAPNACLVAVFVGRPDACNSRCQLQPIDACVGGDACCPAGCNSTSDSDCSAACGNGVVEPEKGETCEDGSQTRCPDTCDDSTGCTADLMTGSSSNCNVVCNNVPIVSPADDDQCCPPGANALSDSDCLPVCGNNAREDGEACDPCPVDCTDEDVCTMDTRAGSGCDVSCTHSPINEPAHGDDCCPAGANALNDSDCAAVCPNGVTEPGEECDGGGRCNAACELILPSSLVHRYSFDGTGTTVVDSIAGANGAAIGSSLSGSGTLVLSGGTSGPYVDLPNGLISELTDLTVEVWLTWRGGAQLQRIFDFGMNLGGENGSGSKTSALNALPTNSSDHYSSFIDFTASTTDADETVLKDDNAALPVNVVTQVAVTFRDSTNTFSLYRNGVRIDQSTSVAGHLSSIDDRNVWIGRGNASSAPRLNATIHEVRIYNTALSDAAVSASASAGPDP